MNLDYYLETIIDENSIAEVVREEKLYKNIEYKLLRKFFSLAHHEINRLLRYLNSRLKSHHYNAEESRQLLKWIKIVKDTIYKFEDSKTPIEINKDYLNVMEECTKFLLESGGSPIPLDFPKTDIIEYEPIFTISNSIEINYSEKKIQFPLKQIGEGSYAKVFKYKDKFYNKVFALKRANKDLTEKELTRFKKEFEIMTELKSPYVVEVYRYDNESNEYIMEYVDKTLYEFISKNNNTMDISKRISLANQVLYGFKYINSKGYLHRDISLTNILIQHYDGLDIIKICDFGLVKTRESTLTSFGTEFKGSLNDGALQLLGFGQYKLVHETYALTRLIFFILTGRTNLEGIKDENIRNFVNKGTHPDNKERYQDIEELELAFRKAVAKSS